LIWTNEKLSSNGQDDKISCAIRLVAGREYRLKSRFVRLAECCRNRSMVPGWMTEIQFALRHVIRCRLFMMIIKSSSRIFRRSILMLWRWGHVLAAILSTRSLESCWYGLPCHRNTARFGHLDMNSMIVGRFFRNSKVSPMLRFFRPGNSMDDSWP